MVAEYGPREYEILLHDVSPDSAKEAVARIRDDLRARGVRVESGVARFPVDGRSADELIHRASPGPGPRRSSPAAPVVVSDRRMQEVYQLAEDKIGAAAKDAGLGKRAEDNTRKMLEQFLRALGYTSITVNFPAS